MILLARCVDVLVEHLFMSFRFKAKENLQRCGDVSLWYFDYKQRSFGTQYVLIYFELYKEFK